MDLFNKVHTFEPMKSHIYEPNIRVISLISLMFNYAKPQMIILCTPLCTLHWWHNTENVHINDTIQWNKTCVLYMII